MAVDRMSGISEIRHRDHVQKVLQASGQPLAGVEQSLRRHSSWHPLTQCTKPFTEQININGSALLFR